MCILITIKQILYDYTFKYNIVIHPKVYIIGLYYHKGVGKISRFKRETMHAYKALINCP